MARPLRVEFPDACYHVMNRGLGRHQVFSAETDHLCFIALLEDITQRWGAAIYAYCCMSTHYHLLLQTPLGNLSRIMRHIDGLYTQRFNRRRRREGPLFRGRYKAILVDADAYLWHLVRYIHLNPVRAGLVTDPGDYPWSSHRLFRLSTAPEWLSRAKVLEPFSHLQEFEEFVAAGDDHNLDEFYRRPRQSSFLGSQEFMDRALAQARLSMEHSRAQRTPQFPTIEAVIRRVGEKAGASRDSILQRRAGRQNTPRTLAIYFSSRVAGFSHPEICSAFGLTRPSAVTQACQRARRLLAQHPTLRVLVEECTRGPEVSS